MSHRHYSNLTVSRPSASPADTTPRYRGDDVPDTPAASGQQDMLALPGSNDQEIDMDQEMEVAESDEEGECERDNLFNAALVPSVHGSPPQSNAAVTPNSLDYSFDVLKREQLVLDKAMNEALGRFGHESHAEVVNALGGAREKLAKYLKTGEKCPANSSIPLPGNPADPTLIPKEAYLNFLDYTLTFINQQFAIMEDPTKMAPVHQAQGQPQDKNLAASLQPLLSAGFGTHSNPGTIHFAVPAGNDPSSNAMSFFGDDNRMNILMNPELNEFSPLSGGDA